MPVITRNGEPPTSSLTGSANSSTAHTMPGTPRSAASDRNRREVDPLGQAPHRRRRPRTAPPAADTAATTLAESNTDSSVSRSAGRAIMVCSPTGSTP